MTGMSSSIRPLPAAQQGHLRMAMLVVDERNPVDVPCTLPHGQRHRLSGQRARVDRDALGGRIDDRRQGLLFLPAAVGQRREGHLLAAHVPASAIDESLKNSLRFIGCLAIASSIHGLSGPRRRHGCLYSRLVVHITCRCRGGNEAAGSRWVARRAAGRRRPGRPGVSKNRDARWRIFEGCGATSPSGGPACRRCAGSPWPGRSAPAGGWCTCATAPPQGP